VHDGFVRRANPLEGLVMNAPADQVRTALERDMLPTQGLPNPYIVTFVDTGPRRGGLRRRHRRRADGPRHRPPAAQHGRRRHPPEDVTLVAVSHFHGDHITGLTTAENRPSSQCRGGGAGARMGLLERQLE
jgi:glyoxylase-like metal-dependent hydrolase (beta-lactamase superfamily II)